MSGVVGIGLDVVDGRRFDRWARRYGGLQLSAVFTAEEVDGAVASGRPGRQLAICFAAKEAVGKALGVGLAGIGWNEVSSTVEGRHLEIRLTGRAAALAGHCGVQRWATALTVCWPTVIVQVIAC